MRPRKERFNAVGNNGLDRPEIQSVRDRQARIARIDPQASGKRLPTITLEAIGDAARNHKLELWIGDL